MDFAALPDLALSPAEIAATLKPWTIRRHPLSATAWRRISARKTRAYLKRGVRHFVSGIAAPFVRLPERRRAPEFVLEHYSETWGRYAWPDPAEPPSRANTVYLEWQGHGYEALRHGLVRCHLLGIARAVERLRPAAVLEVGAGPGINLIALAAMFPDIALAGAELTPTGVAAAKAAQDAPIPEGVGKFAPFPVASRTAHQAIDFRQADARALPFADAAFDLVFTRLALEQMEAIRDAALAEIHRVTKGHALFVEPFPDFNRSRLQRLATRAKSYLSLRIDELPRHGFEPVHVFSAWPHKITNAAGLVLCRRIARPA